MAERRLEVLAIDAESAHIEWLLSIQEEIPAKFSIVGSLKEAFEFHHDCPFDLILLNLSLPDSMGLSSLTKVKDWKPNVAVIVLVSPDEEKIALESSKNGAMGFILVGSLKSMFVSAVIHQAYQRQTTINEIEENQRQFANTISNLPGFIYRCRNDSNWTMEYISNGFNELTGYNPEDVIHNEKISYAQIIHPDDRRSIEHVIQKAIKAGRHFEITYRIITANNSERWVWEQGNAIVTDSGVRYLEGYVADITDKKNYEVQIQSLVSIGKLLTMPYHSNDTSIQMLKEIEKSFKTDNAVLILKDRRNDSFSIVAASGYWRSLLDKQITIDRCNAILAFSKREIFQLDSQLEEQQLCKTFRDKASRFTVVIPFNYQKRVAGIMILGREAKFSQKELDIFKTISDMVISVMDRQSLFLKTEQQLKHLESLHAIDQAITSVFNINVVNKIILDQVCKELGVDAADILILNQPTNMLECMGITGFIDNSIQAVKVPLTTSIAGKVLLENQNIDIPDLENNSGLFARKNIGLENFKAYFARPLTIKGEIVGVIEVFLRQKFFPDREWEIFFEALTTQAAVAYDSYRKYSELRKIQHNTTSSFRSTLEVLSKSLEMHDIESPGHIRRVTSQTIQLAQIFGVNEEDIPNIERGALLHDIGKIGIMDNILQKKGKLTEAEWVEIKRHPQVARELLSNVKLLEDAIDIPYSHHENWDGSGYPQGLKGENIPMAARIFAVVETYDALTSSRPYREAWSKTEALQYLIDQKRIRFDPAVVDAFLKLIK